MPRFKIFCAILFLCATYLGLAGLDHSLFWDDEAIVAIHSKNFLNTGTWTAWSGRNLAAYANGILLDDNLETLDAKPQYWLAAASFKLFGATTWAGRFPFVIVGLAGLLVFILILQREFKAESSLKLYAIALLAFSPAFLLNIRQCRYYALTCTFALLTYYFYRRCWSEKKGADVLWLALSATLLFYSQYLVGGAFLVALAIMHLVCHRSECTKKEWIKFGVAAGLFLLAIVPFLITNPVWVRAETPSDEPWLLRKLTLFCWNMRDLNAMTCLPWVIALALVWILFRHRRHELVRRVAWPWTILIVAFFAVLSLFSFQSTKVPDFAWTRYALPMVPFSFGLVALVLWFVAQRFRWMALAALPVLICTNLLTLSPQTPKFRWLLPAYVGEIHREFRNSTKVVVDYVKANLPQDALLTVNPEFCAYSPMFYLDDRVRFCCLMNASTRLPRETLDRLNAPLFVEENYPEWFIAFGNQGQTAPLLEHFSRIHTEAGRDVSFSYSYQLETNLNVFWFDTSRPELPFHTFGPKKDFDPATHSVYVFRRLAEPSGNFGSEKSN